MIALLAAALLISPAASYCGDGQCTGSEDWLWCAEDCPQPAGEALVRGRDEAQTQVALDGELTVHVRMSGVPLDRVLLFSGVPSDPPLRFARTNGTGILSPYAFFSIRSKPMPLDTVRLHLRVNRSWLEAEGLSPREVALFHGAGGGWTPLETVHTGRDYVHEHYVAEAHSLGNFSIGSARGITTEDTPVQWSVRKAAVPERQTGLINDLLRFLGFSPAG
jgi:hypothetical protein